MSVQSLRAGCASGGGNSVLLPAGGCPRLRAETQGWAAPNQAGRASLDPVSDSRMKDALP
jgi:hypothetical protein